MTSHLSVVMVVGVRYREFLFFVCYGAVQVVEPSMEL